jgi:hypothetical protein
VRTGTISYWEFTLEHEYSCTAVESTAELLPAKNLSRVR